MVFLKTKNMLSGNTIITACMDRQENLQKALETWLSIKAVDEIVIVDWSSKTELIKNLNVNDSIIKIIRVNNEPNWVLSYAFNLAASFAGYNKILKIDADIKVHPDFFLIHHLEENLFYSGNIKMARNENERYLNGILYLELDDFLNIGGYNEYITSYGWDDGDLYERLQNQGLKRENINNDFVYHIPHNGRHKNQPKVWPELNLSNRDISYMKNLTNRMLASRLLKWDRSKKMRDYSIKKVHDNYYICQAKSFTQNQVPAETLMKAEIMAFKERLRRETDIKYHSFYESLSFDQTKEILGFLLDAKYVRSQKEISDYLYKIFNIGK